MHDHDFPRRAHLDRFTPAERAIYDAVLAVEALPADARLTDAIVLLQAARDSVADFVDGINQRRFVTDGTPVADNAVAKGRNVSTVNLPTREKDSSP